MFNRRIASALAIMGAFMAPSHIPLLPTGQPLDSHGSVSRGKSGKTSRKSSGAASLKRAATKRNNIRKNK